MRRLDIALVGLCVGIALPMAAPAASAAVPRPASASCCTAPAGTIVKVEFNDEISTKDVKNGDRFDFHLAAPLIVNGRILLKAGTPGVGEVVDSMKPGMGGKAAKLVLAARYLDDHGHHIALQSLRLAISGKDNSMTANAVGLTGFVFMPLGFAGLAVTGGQAAVPAGTVASAKLSGDLTLPPMGRATAHAVDEADAFAKASSAEPDNGGSIAIPPPPPGQGQVVFFRAKSLMGTGQWFNVRENGAALGKLSNGAYFIQVAAPGAHVYTATTEPEAKDHLKLEIDPGDTYYVEGVLTRGVVMGTADLTPSDRATFDKDSKDLKLAPPPSAATPDDDTNDVSNDATNAPASAGQSH